MTKSYPFLLSRLLTLFLTMASLLTSTVAQSTLALGPTGVCRVVLPEATVSAQPVVYSQYIASNTAIAPFNNGFTYVITNAPTEFVVSTTTYITHYTSSNADPAVSTTSSPSAYMTTQLRLGDGLPTGTVSNLPTETNFVLGWVGINLPVKRGLLDDLDTRSDDKEILKERDVDSMQVHEFARRTQSMSNVKNAASAAQAASPGNWMSDNNADPVSCNSATAYTLAHGQLLQGGSPVGKYEGDTVVALGAALNGNANPIINVGFSLINGLLNWQAPDVGVGVFYSCGGVVYTVFDPTNNGLAVAPYGNCSLVAIGGLSSSSCSASLNILPISSPVVPSPSSVSLKSISLRSVTLSSISLSSLSLSSISLSSVSLSSISVSSVNPTGFLSVPSSRSSSLGAVATAVVSGVVSGVSQVLASSASLSSISINTASPSLSSLYIATPSFSSISIDTASPSISSLYVATPSLSSLSIDTASPSLSSLYVASPSMSSLSLASPSSFNFASPSLSSLSFASPSSIMVQPSFSSVSFSSFSFQSTAISQPSISSLNFQSPGSLTIPSATPPSPALSPFSTTIPVVGVPSSSIVVQVSPPSRSPVSLAPPTVPVVSVPATQQVQPPQTSLSVPSGSTPGVIISIPSGSTPGFSFPSGTPVLPSTSGSLSFLSPSVSMLVPSGTFSGSLSVPGGSISNGASLPNPTVSLLPPSGTYSSSLSVLGGSIASSLSLPTSTFTGTLAVPPGALSASFSFPSGSYTGTVSFPSGSLSLNLPSGSIGMGSGFLPTVTISPPSSSGSATGPGLPLGS